jgi:hypothetical protein
LAGFGLSACGPSDPLDLRVESTTQLDLDIWRSNSLNRLSPEQLADFNEAYQQIKFQLMADGKARGAVAVESAALKLIDGLTVREVLETGFDSELARDEAEFTLRSKAIEGNRQLRTRPGDIESQRYLADLDERQRRELQEEERDIARIKTRLTASGLPAHRPAADPRGPI